MSASPSVTSYRYECWCRAVQHVGTLARFCVVRRIRTNVQPTTLWTNNVEHNQRGDKGPAMNLNCDRSRLYWKLTILGTAMPYVPMRPLHFENPNINLSLVFPPLCPLRTAAMYLCAFCLHSEHAISPPVRGMVVWSNQARRVEP